MTSVSPLKTQLISVAEKQDPGTCKKHKLEKFSYMVGKKEDGTPYFVPYSIKKKTSLFMNPKKIDAGTNSTAYRSVEYTKEGQRSVTILKSKWKGVERTYVTTGEKLDKIHKNGPKRFIEQKGVIPDCRRGVRITERYQSGLHKNFKVLPHTKRVCIFAQMLQAVIGLKSENFVQTELKLNNTLYRINEYGGYEVVVCDFDEAIDLSSNSWKEEDLYFTPEYTAPSMEEIAHNHKSWTDTKIQLAFEQENVYQLAISFLLLTDKRIHENKSFFKKVETEYFPTTEFYSKFIESSAPELKKRLLDEGCTESQADIIIKSLSTNREMRPSLEELQKEFPCQLLTSG